MTFATISSWMRFNFFSRSEPPEPAPTPRPEQPLGTTQVQEPPQPQTGRTFPADEVVWGIVIRNGFDEIDDPWYHRGTTQHAYLEGNDNVALCGFRPPQSGPRTRRRSRLGLPTDGEHPMCGTCARMVVAPRPRPRVPVPVQVSRPAVAVQVSRAPQPIEVIRMGAPAGAPMPFGPVAAPAPTVQPPPQATGAPVMSPWVRRASETTDVRPAPGAHADGNGLMSRGIHAESRD